MFSNWFYLCLSLLFSVVISNVGCCMLYKNGNFSFCPPKSIINSFPLFDFLGFCWAFCRTTKKWYKFLFSYQFYTSGWVLFVDIFWYFGPSFIQLDDFQSVLHSLGTVMLINIKNLTQWNANWCFSLWTAYFIFEAFQILFPTASLIFTTAKLFHQVIWERTKLEASHCFASIMAVVLKLWIYFM